MKILTTFQIILFISSLTFAQGEIISLVNRIDGLDVALRFDTRPYSTKSSGNKTTVDYLNFTDEGIPGTPGLPSNTYYIAIPPRSTVRVQLYEQNYNFIKNVDVALNPEIEFSKDSVIIYKDSEPNLSTFASDQFPSTDLEVIGYTWIRDYYCVVVRINTHSYNWKKKEIRELQSCKLKIDFIDVTQFGINLSPPGEFDKILDKIILNYGSASQFRSYRPNFPAADSTGNWIDYTKEYVKLKIPDDGIYKIDYDQLISYGVNPQGLNPKTLKLFLKGQEVPIFVFGENDLSFDQADYIEFWCERNYSPENYREIVSLGEDYINYLDRYSDTSTVWLTWDGTEGKRIPIQTTNLPGLNDTVSTHKAKIHLEDDERLWYYDSESPRVQLPFWQENKVWTWHFLGNAGNFTFDFEASDFVPSANVDVTVRMISRVSIGYPINCHRFGQSLNSANPQDTIVFSFKETVNFSADYNGSQLLTGNNTIRVFGMQNDSLKDHQALIDWVDIDYQRNNVALNDSILILVKNDVLSSKKVIKVTGFTQQTSNILVYKVKPQLKKITAIDISNSVLTFTDTVTANDEYFIIKESLTRSPLFLLKKNFINLREPTRSADYIIISNKVLQTSANEYINLINANYETRNELIFVDDIYDEFSYGYDKPEAIQNFLEYANLNWISPAPSYLLLLGDANYDYKNKITPPPTVQRKNLVPSYGDPVSDVWFTMWDSSNANLPQMFVGRIPAESNEEVEYYLDKHQTYLNKNYNDFNKRYLFFSGGDPTDPGQIELLKSTNDIVLNNIVRPAPIGGDGIHFYKTLNPPSNLGPYTREQIDNAIDSTGLFISYIGHSGTETWDNGITEVSDLKPKFSDRLSLISDFGCSTGKFAEPNVDAFGELFVSASTDGQAIAYLGNSSWGYVSTSTNFPQLFYNQLLLDSSFVYSEAHYLAKIELLNQYGTSDVNRVFNYCNILFGDPLIAIKLPHKPNFSVSNNLISLVDQFPTDVDDSVRIKIGIINFGKVLIDSLTININDFYLGNISYSTEFKIPVPYYKKMLYISIPTEGLVGQHNLEITLDRNNLFDEIYENDNSTIFSFIVYSSSIRPIEAERFYNSERSEFRFLNPVFLIDENVSSINVDIADNPDFNNPISTDITMDTLVTSSMLSSLQTDKRYWWRARLNQPQGNWSQPFSFFNENIDFTWFFNRSFNIDDIHYENVAFDSTDNSWKLPSYQNVLGISSAGGDDGEYGSIKLNGSERLPNTYYWGIATAIIDSITFEPTDFNYFLYWNSYSDTLLLNYIDSLQSGTLLAMTICSDGAQSILGFNPGTPIRQMIETLGSLYVDSVLYRDSWCIIGKKGAAQGTVPESFRRRFSGPAELDTSVIVSNQNGWIEFPVIKNSRKWLTVTKTDSLPSGTNISYMPLGIKEDSSIDTLAALQFNNNVSDISQIDANIYPEIKLISIFTVNENNESPVFKKIGLDFVPVPDLATNYQTVSATEDSVLIGKSIGLQFYIYNVGESKADSFDVKVEVINDDNSRQTIFTHRVDSLSAEERKYFELDYNTSQGSGSKSFLISIDPNNEIRELFEDNNFFSVPFYVQPDTSISTIALTFDGYDIIDGDYISPNPAILIELNDESLLPITDPSSVLVYLNDDLISSDTSIISYTFSSENPKVTVDLKPSLSDGDYTLKVLWKNSEGNIVDSSGAEKYFQVSSEAQLLYVYNYPNPTSGETNFTFKLTQIPDEITIKIFTIAGRLIREIDKNSSELKFDFNKIYWDGRDEDGDPIGNGVYLYKVIMQAGDISQNVTQKLAIVK